MIYRTANNDELTALLERLSQLVGQDAVIDLKKHSPKRTNRQNRYMRLLFKAFSDETGYEVAESEYLFKTVVNPDIFMYEKNGITFIRSSADIDTKQMATSIDRFHRYAAEAGFPLPQAYNENDMINLENRYEA